MRVNYQQICQNLLKDLSQRQKEIISCRFGLGKNERETLSSIGERLGITRERVRQIEKDSIIRQIKPKLKKYQKIFQYFAQYFKKSGGLKREDILLEQLGNKKNKAEIYFLLSISQDFEKYKESANFYSLWTNKESSLILAKKVIIFFIKEFKKNKKPLTLKELKDLSQQNIEIDSLISYLEISKKIQQNKDGVFGLKDWPEINPRGIKDRAYLVLKENNTPLHFNQIAELIGANALPQTVHNELIKNQKFVLVGRGTYALKDWGYYCGNVNEVISKILKETENPLTKEEILEKVLAQRLVKKSTILLNLNNKKDFLKTSEGKYKIVEKDKSFSSSLANARVREA